MSLNFSTAEIELDGGRVKGAFTELGNAVIALFWEGDEPRLGTLTATLPNNVSSPLLGDRNQILGQVIGEQLTTICGKMALVSTNISERTANMAGRKLLELAKRLASGGKKS